MVNPLEVIATIAGICLAAIVAGGLIIGLIQRRWRE